MNLNSSGNWEKLTSQMTKSITLFFQRFTDICKFFMQGLPSIPWTYMPPSVITGCIIRQANISVMIALSGKFLIDWWISSVSFTVNFLVSNDVMLLLPAMLTYSFPLLLTHVTSFFSANKLLVILCFRWSIAALGFICFRAGFLALWCSNCCLVSRHFGYCFLKYFQWHPFL